MTSEIDTALLDNTAPGAPGIAAAATDGATRLLQVAESLAKLAVGNTTATLWATAINGLNANANLTTIGNLLGNSTTAAGARAGLGAAASGANTDITSLGTLSSLNVSPGVSALAAVTANSVAVSGGMSVGGNIAVTGPGTFAALSSTTLTASGNATVGGTFGVTGVTTLGALNAATVSATGNATVGGALGVTGITTLNTTNTGTLSTTGNLTVSGTLGVTGSTTLGATNTGALMTTGNHTISGTLGVTGASTFAGIAATTGAFSGNTTVGGTLGVTGASTFAGIAATTGAFSGNTTVGGTLGVTGATTLAGLSATTITASGTTTLAAVTATTITVSGVSTLAAVNATTLGATGLATLSGGATITGVVTIGGKTPAATDGTNATGTWPVAITGAAGSVAATNVTGIHTVAQGGTGVGTLAQGGLLTGAGAGAVTTLSGTATGQVPVWNSVTGAWGPGSVIVPDYTVTTKKLGDGAVTPDTPPSMRVSVNAIKKFDGAGNAVQWSGGFLDLTAYVPGTGTSVWVMVYLNATAAVYAAAGAASATPMKPVAIGGQTPLAYILLYAGQTTIQPADIYDWRTDFAAFAVGGGTGSGYSAVGHLHGQGGESFVAVAATDEGRVTTPNVAGMSVYVQPTRYSDTSSVVQQFPGGASTAITRPVSFPYYVAVGLSQAGTITLNYGAENATPVRGPFLNTTDIPLAYLLVRTGSTRTILNDDALNALILDARRPYTFSSPAAGGIASVGSGGTGQSSFATAGLLYTPGGTTGFVSVPATVGTPTVGLGFNPTVTPAGANADLFLGGGGVVATGATNIPGTVNGLHILASTKTGTGTIGTFNGLTIDAQTIGTINNALNVIGNAVVSGNMSIGGGLTFGGTFNITAAGAITAQFNSQSAGGIVEVVNGAALATGLLTSWRVNGVEQANMGPGGVLTVKGITSSGNVSATGTLTVQGQIASQGAAASLVAYDTVAPNTDFAKWYRSGTHVYLNTSDGGNIWDVDSTFGGLTFVGSLNISSTNPILAQFNALSSNTIVEVVNGAPGATSLLTSWRVNGVEQANMGPGGVLTVKGVTNSGNETVTGTITAQSTINSQGTNAGFRMYDRIAPNTAFATWQRTGTALNLASSESGIIFSVDAVAGQIAQPTWTAPTLINSWVNYGSTYLPAGFYKDLMGTVHLRGMMANGTIGADCFVLPLGYRPSLNAYIAANSNQSFASMFVSTAGSVNFQTGSNVWVSVNGITYDTR